MYIKVEFDPDGKRYVYKTPIEVCKGKIVLVNVYGVIKAAKVVATGKKPPSDYVGPIKSIVGVGYMLEEFEQPEPVKLSLLDRIAQYI